MDFSQKILNNLNDNQRKVWKGISPFLSKPKVNDSSMYRKKRANYLSRLENEQDKYNETLDVILRVQNKRIKQEQDDERRLLWELERKKRRRKKVLFFILTLPISPILLIYFLSVKLFKLIRSSDEASYTAISIILLALLITGSFVLFPFIFKSRNTIANIIKWSNFSFILIHSVITYITGIKDMKYAYDDDIKASFFIKLIDSAIVFAFMIGASYATRLLQIIYGNSSGYYGVVSVICHFVLILTALISYLVFHILNNSFDSGCQDYSEYFWIIGETGLITILGLLAYVILAVVLGVIGLDFGGV